MKEVTTLSDLPNVPAVYALYGGQGKGMYVAYVGQAKKELKTRIIEHLVRHNSSVTTGVNTVSLNPDLVTKVGWWEHNDFSNLSKLAAAELVAFDALDPVLRSREPIPTQANQFYSDSVFRKAMIDLFRGEMSGHFIVPTLQTAFARILTLEKRTDELIHRVYELEQRLGER